VKWVDLKKFSFVNQDFDFLSNPDELQVNGIVRLTVAFE
jgi:hypothetical protein